VVEADKLAVLVESVEDQDPVVSAVGQEVV
jgi:hypothetical protein